MLEVQDTPWPSFKILNPYNLLSNISFSKKILNGLGCGNAYTSFRGQLASMNSKISVRLCSAATAII
jgi:hypothetical protein